MPSRSWHALFLLFALVSVLRAQSTLFGSWFHEQLRKTTTHRFLFCHTFRSFNNGSTNSLLLFEGKG
jgi:hypothetical protein